MIHLTANNATGVIMFDRKALAESLHALHGSEVKAGKDGAILKQAIGAILDAIAGTTSGLGEADGKHLDEAITALAEGHPFLARSSILLILEGPPASPPAGDHPPRTLTKLREKLDAIAV